MCNNKYVRESLLNVDFDSKYMIMNIDFDFEYGKRYSQISIWETLSHVYWCWYPYGRRYPGYIDLNINMGGVIPDIHMGDGIPDILILNVGGVTPELIWSWGVRSQAEFDHEGHVPKLSSFDREGYVPKLNLITRGTFPSWNRYKGYVPKHKRGESRKILWGTFPSFIAGQFPENLWGKLPSFIAGQFPENRTKWFAGFRSAGYTRPNNNKEMAISIFVRSFGCIHQSPAEQQ